MVKYDTKYGLVSSYESTSFCYRKKEDKEQDKKDPGRVHCMYMSKRYAPEDSDTLLAMVTFMMVAMGLLQHTPQSERSAIMTWKKSLPLKSVGVDESYDHIFLVFI